jgi:CRISPR-associated exonuclease Cas4
VPAPLVRVARNGRVLIPVELKSGPARRPPPRGHVFQAAAYCLLLEETTGVRPSHAILRYADRDIEVPYTRQLEGELRSVIQEMRDSLRTGDELHCSHTHPRRCASCSKAHACGEALIALQR